VSGVYYSICIHLSVCPSSSLSVTSPALQDGGTHKGCGRRRMPCTCPLIVLKDEPSLSDGRPLLYAAQHKGSYCLRVCVCARLYSVCSCNVWPCVRCVSVQVDLFGYCTYTQTAQITHVSFVCTRVATS